MVSEISFDSDRVEFSSVRNFPKGAGKLYGSSSLFTKGGWPCSSMERTSHVFHSKRPREIEEVISSGKEPPERPLASRKIEPINVGCPKLAGFWKKAWKKHKVLIVVFGVVVVVVVVVAVVATSGVAVVAMPGTAAGPIVGSGVAAAEVLKDDKPYASNSGSSLLMTMKMQKDIWIK